MRFSIVITSYRQSGFLKEAVTSAYKQTYKEDYQIVIVNDSGLLQTSNHDFLDDTFFIGVAKNKTHLPLLKIDNPINIGLQKSYNIGCFYSEGNWIIRLDGDDKLLPNALQDLSDFIDEQTDPKVAFIYSDLKIMGTNKVRIYPEWNRTLSGLQNIGHLQAIRRDVSEQIGHWDVSLKYSADTDAIIKIIEAGYRLRHIPKVLYENRLHSEQYTQQFPKHNNPNEWKNKIFNRTMIKRPELWPESYQDVIMQTTGSYYWKSEALVVQKYCIGNGLDLGCSNRKKSCWAIGVDINREGGKIPELIWNAEEELPFRSQTLDFVMGTHIAEHLKDPATSIVRWMKKIKRGGFLILIIPDKNFVPNIGTKGCDPSHLNDWTPEDFKEQILPKLEIIPHEVIEYGAIGNNWSFKCILRRM